MQVETEPKVIACFVCFFFCSISLLELMLKDVLSSWNEAMKLMCVSAAIVVMQHV